MGVQYFGLIKDETQPHSFLVSSDINRGYQFFVNLAAFDAKKGPLVWAVVAIESLRKKRKTANRSSPFSNY